MEVELKFDSWDRIVSSVCIQSMNIPLSIIVCCSPIVLCRLFSIISCFRTINHLWYIYIHKRKKKEYNKKTENGMRYVFFNLCYFFLFEIILFYPMYNNFLCHLYFYDHWIIYFFISPFFFTFLLSDWYRIN